MSQNISMSCVNRLGSTDMAAKPPTLLIDGDEFIYKATTVNEVETRWDEDIFTLHTDFSQCKRNLLTALGNICEALETRDIIFCVSSPNNFRKTILPSYKEARKSVRKPMAYKELLEYAKSIFPYVVWDGLEADDVMGVLATEPRPSGSNRRIMVSSDKDMQTVPGWLFRQGELVQTSEKDADTYWLMQTLMGDATDGYKGCPGAGIKKAETVLADKSKTQWESVVATFVKAGLTEEDALVQARCARILRHTDYNTQDKWLKLWTPPENTNIN